MKIAVNALYLIPGKVGGSEIYLRELLAALARVDRENQYLVLTNREARGALALGENFREIPQPVSGRNRPLRAFWEQAVLPGLVRREKIDVLHSPGSAAPLRLPCASVVTILDLIYLRFPETFPFWTRAMVRFLTAASARAADAVIALSEYSRDEIMWELDVSWDRIHAVPLGGGSVSASRLSPEERVDLLRPLGVRGPFILTVSAAHPHKNLMRLIEGFYRWRCSGGRHQLVVAGIKHDRHFRRLWRRVERMDLEGEVVFTGWISEELKSVLFAQAAMFVYPSLLEGFGLPVLEAMRLGLPTACSAVPSLDEVAGDAAERFDPYSTSEIARALEACLNDFALREKLGKAGPAQAAKFSWEKTARATLEVYARALEIKASRRRIHM